MLAVALALGAALSWGCADFLGGLASRKAPVLGVLAVTIPVGALAAAAALALRPQPFPGTGAAAWSALAGVAGLVGLAALYRGLAVGAMAVVAPLSATAPVVPVAVGLLRGERPSWLQAAGVAVALVGIVLVSREPGELRAGAAGAILGVAAAAGFGLFFIALDEAGSDGALWPTLLVRLSSAAVLGAALAVRRPRLPRGALALAPLVAVGVLDMSANGLFAAASSRGLVSVISVLASLYPAVVVLLARLVLHERLALPQAIGAAAALGGACLISAG